jgi:glycosyltransferase involved in cell wall biosynthesis
VISFIIPTRNEEKALERTLSTLSAYAGPKEIIVSDGNSTDATLDNARQYADQVITHSGPVRQNIAQGRNAGAYAARGDILVFLDADVIIDDIDAFFERALAYFEDGRVSALTVTCRVFPEDETFMDWLIFGAILPLSFYIQNNVLLKGGSTGEFQMVRGSAFANVGGYDDSLVTTEDMDLFWRLAKGGRTVFAVDLAVHHTGRRAHIVGWPKLLRDWAVDFVSTILFHRPVTQEWEVIR